MLLLVAGAGLACWWAHRRAARREAALARQVAQLEAQLAEREAQLSRVAQQRRELLANVSHDLRTPLSSMQGYLELLLLRHGSFEPAEERNYLQTAARQGEKLGRLVNDLFDLTRLEAGDLALQPEDFALGELVQDVVQKFAHEARRRGVRLAACDAQSAPHVHADLALVARVLENLLDNAIRHTPADGSVTVGALAGGSRAALTVSDTGEGIAAADLPGVFDRYDRGSRVQRAGASPGLGLAIARRIVRLHGGELAIRSTPGTGTSVSFDLPTARPAARPAGLAA
ncbi:MAG: HAMP domain-containing sensor histidine kinase [Piscinibacter sp.]